MQINVIDEDSRFRATLRIKSKALPFTIRILKYDEKRTLPQNSLMWDWITQISEHTGESKDEVHERFKDKFLSRIYERDDPDYAQMMESLRDVYKLDKGTALKLRKDVIRMTSTTKATKKQMTEYLNDIKMDTFDKLGIILTSEEL